MLFHQNPYAPLMSPIRATCLPHLILLNMITRVTVGELQFIKLVIVYPVIFIFYSEGQLRHCTKQCIKLVSLATLFTWNSENMIFEMSGSHSGVAEDSTLVGCDAVSTGEQLPTLRRIVFP